MQNAQIWKSIEALCDEAEAVMKDDTPMMALVKSTAPPAMAREQKANLTTDAQTEKPALAVLTSQAPPPAVNFVSKTNPSANADDVSLSNATMAEIAAAIDRASKAPKTQIMSQQPQIMSNQLHHDLMTEVRSAVRNVLANELLTTTPRKGAVKSNPPKHPAIEAKPEKRKVASKKTASKKTVAKKTVAKKTATKKPSAKKKSRKTKNHT